MSGANLFNKDYEPENLPEPGEEPDWLDDLVPGEELGQDDVPTEPTIPTPDWWLDDDDTFSSDA